MRNHRVKESRPLIRGANGKKLLHSPISIWQMCCRLWANPSFEFLQLCICIWRNTLHRKLPSKHLESGFKSTCWMIHSLPLEPNTLSPVQFYAFIFIVVAQIPARTRHSCQPYRSVKLLFSCIRWIRRTIEMKKKKRANRISIWTSISFHCIASSFVAKITSNPVSVLLVRLYRTAAFQHFLLRRRFLWCVTGSRIISHRPHSILLWNSIRESMINYVCVLSKIRRQFFMWDIDSFQLSKLKLSVFFFYLINDQSHGHKFQKLKNALTVD